MYPAATLFLDCCVQEELWPAGSWPLVAAERVADVARMFALARERRLRQGGVVCRHASDGDVPAVPNAPRHCSDPRTWSARPPGCRPELPVRIVSAAADPSGDELDRATAIYVDSGCAVRPDAAPAHARAFAHLVAGVRDVVVLGAGIEFAMAHAVDALLERRIRTHVALDASGAADEVAAQPIVALWKRRGVDVTTVAMIERMLQRN